MAVESTELMHCSDIVWTPNPEIRNAVKLDKIGNKKNKKKKQCF